MADTDFLRRVHHQYRPLLCTYSLLKKWNIIRFVMYKWVLLMKINMLTLQNFTVYTIISITIVGKVARDTFSKHVKMHRLETHFLRLSNISYRRLAKQRQHLLICCLYFDKYTVHEEQS